MGSQLTHTHIAEWNVDWGCVLNIGMFYQSSHKSSSLEKTHTRSWKYESIHVNTARDRQNVPNSFRAC